MIEPVSTYIHHLPPIFQKSQFIDGFLLAFEKLLTQAAPTDGWDALETKINKTASYLRPLAVDTAEASAPASFLPWLAGWVALTLRDDWPEETQRRFIREIVPLYRLRGTKAGMKRMLEIYLGNDVPITIYDRQTASEFAFDPPAHFFQVRIDINTQDTTVIRQIQQIAQAIIEQEKPAHTFYGLQIRIPTMRLLSEELAAELKQNPLILGENTLLGTQQA
ncbi:MAG: phage tail protein I [Chloroflexota bacterium]